MLGINFSSAFVLLRKKAHLCELHNGIFLGLQAASLVWATKQLMGLDRNKYLSSFFKVAPFI